MTKRFLAISLAAAGFFPHSFPAAAGPLWDGITNVVSTLRADGTTNLWTEADLVDALGLLNRRYWRDMETAAGRAAWHGAVKGSSASVVTNSAGAERLVRRDVYHDGYVHFTTSAPPRRMAVDADRVEQRERAKRRRIEWAQAAIGRFRAMSAPAEGATLDEQIAYGRAATAALVAERELRALTNGVQTVTVTFRPPAGKGGE